MTTERLQEESLTGNTEESELWTNNFPMSEAKDSVQNTKQACQLFHDDDERDGKKSPEFSKIKIPTKVLKRGRPKSVEVTVIGLPRKKQRRKKTVTGSRSKPRSRSLS